MYQIYITFKINTNPNLYDFIKYLYSDFCLGGKKTVKML